MTTGSATNFKTPCVWSLGPLEDPPTQSSAPPQLFSPRSHSVQGDPTNAATAMNHWLKGTTGLKHRPPLGSELSHPQLTPNQAGDLWGNDAKAGCCYLPHEHLERGFSQYTYKYIYILYIYIYIYVYYQCVFSQTKIYTNYVQYIFITNMYVITTETHISFHSPSWTSRGLGLGLGSSDFQSQGSHWFLLGNNISGKQRIHKFTKNPRNPGVFFW